MVGQFVGNELFGAYVSGFVGAVVMTLTAYLRGRLSSTMPVSTSTVPVATGMTTHSGPG